MEGEAPRTPADNRLATEHGRTRRAQGYSLLMIVDDTQLVERAIYDLVQESLLELDLSYLVAELGRLTDSLEDKLQESLRAYLEEKAA